MTTRAAKLSLLAAIIATLAVGALALQAKGQDDDARGSGGGGLREVVGFNIKSPDYAGRFGVRGGREGRMLIKITKRSRRGEPLEGLFQPKEVTVDCVSDGQPSRRRDTLSPYVIYFHDEGRSFEGQNYSFDSSRGYEGVLLFRGRLEQNGARAEGSLTRLDNPTQANNEPYCLARRLPWTAKRLANGPGQELGRGDRGSGKRAGGLREVVETNIKNPDYAGRFEGFNDTRSGRVSIKITKRSRRGEPLEGLFQPKQVTLTCSGASGPRRRRDRLSPYLIYFHGAGRSFEGQNYSNGQGGYESVLLFRGHLENGARAKGSLTSLDNPTQANGEPYCYAGRLPWTAKRLR